MRTFLLFALCLFACSHQPSRRPSSEGNIFPLQGIESQRGTFVGELEIRPDSDGILRATRIVTYDDFRFEGLKVQTIWTGTARLEADSLTLSFQLKRGDFFQKVDGEIRTKEQFHVPLTVAYSLPLNGTPVNHDGIAESIVGDPRAAEADPLWKDERQRFPSFGDSHPWIGKAAMSTLFASITKRYRNDPFVKNFRDRPECQDENTYFVLDPTDFQFLRANPDTIRLNNKVLDTISLVEATQRRNAYAPPLIAKAKAFDLDMETNHLNELGLYATAEPAGPNSPARFEPNGDAGLWSGMYAGSQAMRWLVTREPQALENFRKSTKGMMLLMDVTGDPKEFARTAALLEEGKEPTGLWQRGVAPYQNVRYLKGGNNDMVKGIFHAFAWAFEILPENDPLRAEVAEHAARLPKLKVMQEILHVSNRFAAAGLAALATGNKDQLALYRANFDLAMKPADFLRLNQGFYYGGIADWSGINLATVSQVSEILIAGQIARKYGGYANNNIYQRLRKTLLDTWSVYRSARRDALTIAAYAFGEKESLNHPETNAPKDWPNKSIWNQTVADSIWGLREIPLPTSAHTVYYDFTLSPSWCPSLWPRAPWKSFGDETEMSFFQQGAVNYPIFEAIAVESDNFWTSGPPVTNGGSTTLRHGRVDYLHPYWMARLAVMFSDQE